MSSRKREISPSSDQSPPRKQRDSSPPSRSAGSRDHSPRRTRDQSPSRRGGGRDGEEGGGRDGDEERGGRGGYRGGGGRDGDEERGGRGGYRGGGGRGGYDRDGGRGRGGNSGGRGRGRRDGSPPQQRRRRDSPGSEIPESMMYGKPEDKEAEDKPKIQKEKPDFKPSGKLNTAGAESGTGPILKWAEPQEARLPTKKWRLYVFKEDKPLDPYYIHRQSAYLFGRDRQVVDIPLDHPSCSKQHAVLQYRCVDVDDEDFGTTKVVKPYLLDLESTNGTFVNGERMEGARYYELREKDVLKFGLSTREFVILHELSV